MIKHYHLHLIPNYDGFEFSDIFINNNITNDIEDVYKK